MNKDLIDQLPADEQLVAERLTSAARAINLPPGFRSNLETQLMDSFPSENKKTTPLVNFLKPVGWVFLAVAGILLTGWIFRTLVPGIQPAAGPTAIQEISFAEKVHTGEICTGSLAAAHGFAVFLTDSEKTKFLPLEPGNTTDEYRSFAWSTDGQQLAILANITGSGAIFVTDASGSRLEYSLDKPGAGYLMGMAWSRDGSQFVTWSGQDNTKVYVLDASGKDVIQKELEIHINGTPQFTPDGNSILFSGSNTETFGLFEASLQDAHIELISPLVEDETGFAFSPDGSQLAYMEMDRSAGEARLVAVDMTSRSTTTLGTLPIPKGSGSSIPQSANLSWMEDGQSLVFDFGFGAFDRAIYLARADGGQFIKVVDSGYAPTVSADGQCLAYINDKQVLLLDLTAGLGSANSATPVLLAELPMGHGIPNYQLDKLQWSPER